MERKSIIYLILLFSALFCAFYYQVAWQGDVLEILIQVEKLFNTKFAINDFYVNTFNDLSPRYYVGEFIYICSKFLNIDYAYFVAYLNIFRIVTLVILSYYFFNRITKNKEAALISTYLIAFSFYAFPQVPLQFINPDLTGNGLALNFILLSFICLYQRMISLSIIILGLAMFFHPVMAILGLFMFTIIVTSIFEKEQLYKEIRNIKNYIALLFYMAFFLLYYLPYKKTMVNITPLSSEEFVSIIFKYRHPFYLASNFSWNEWLLYFANIFFFIYMLFILRKEDLTEKRQFILFRNVLIYIITLGLIGYFFVEIYPIKLAASMMPYRSFIFFLFIFMALYGIYTVNRFKKGDILHFVILHLPFVFIRRNINVMITSYIILILYSIFADYFCYEKLRINRVANRWINERNYLHLILVVLILFFSVSIYKFKFDIPNINAPENKIFKFIKENTEENAIILADLSAGKNVFSNPFIFNGKFIFDDPFIFNNKIRFLSRRSTVIDSSFPFLEKYWREWAKRYKEAIIELSKADKPLPEVRLKDLCEKYRVNYIVRIKQIENPKEFELVSVFEEIFLYKYNLNPAIALD